MKFGVSFVTGALPDVAGMRDEFFGLAHQYTGHEDTDHCQVDDDSQLTSALFDDAVDAIAFRDDFLELMPDLDILDTWTYLSPETDEEYEIYIDTVDLLNHVVEEPSGKTSPKEEMN